MIEPCIQEPWPTNKDWLRSFNANAQRDRVPVAGMLELTRRCNLNCVHCYLDPEARRDAAAEMSAAQVKDLIDQVVAEGCLYFSLTGGDPTIRPDFPDLYAYARGKGLLVSVLCNGTVLAEPVLRVLQRHPPSSVEITLYGATAATFDAITRVDGSYERCWRGIRGLMDRGVRVVVKSVLMTLNVHEIPQIRRAARDLGLRHRVDPVLFPRLSDGSRSPLDYRLDPERAVACEMADDRLRGQWEKYYAERHNWPPSKRLYECGAGRTCFFIDAAGRLSPCLMLAQHRFDLHGRSFSDLWKSEIREAVDREPRPGYPCSGCDMRAACNICPALNHLETGSEDEKCEYVCSVAKARHRMLACSQSGTYAGVPS